MNSLLTFTYNTAIRRTILIVFCVLSISNLSAQSRVDFGVERGFYTAAFNLSLSTTLPNATIKYSTDAEWPINGSVYSSPINISTTTVVKAIAYNAIDTLEVAAHSYIFLNDVVNQAANLSIYPPDTEMDPDVVNDPQYSAALLDGLQHIPTISVSLPEDHFIDTAVGIYANPFDRGIAWERMASFEYIEPNGVRFQENMGIRIHGGASRGRDKKGFRIYFRGDYGPTKLDYPLFGTSYDHSVDAIVLRPRGGNSWLQHRPEHRDRAQLTRDQYARELQEGMGYVTSHGIQTHLYINGVYWGEYNTIEFLNQSFMQSYLGGDEESFEIWNHSGQEEGLSDTWTPLHDYLNADTSLLSQSVYDSLNSVVDLENLADYVLMNFFGGNTDWDNNNWYGARNVVDNGKWQFFAWDSEQFFKEMYWNATSKHIAYAPTNLFNRLMEYPDFKQLFMDKVHCRLDNNGILSPPIIDSMWMAIYATLGNSVVAESARWGDAKRDSLPYTLNAEYLTEQNRLRTAYFPFRADTVKLQMVNAGFLDLSVQPVDYSQYGGQIPTSFQLSLTNPNSSGTLYYTIDGTDPRAPGGGISSSAMVYSAPISLIGVVEVNARVLFNGNWSAACPKTFYTPQDYSGLVINEIHYDPNDSITATDTIAGNNYEFIELKNTSTTDIHLHGINLQGGVNYKFNDFIVLAPGQFFVLAENEERFQEKYGFLADGQFKGKLDNGGAQLELIDPFGNLTDVVDYDDGNGWPTEPDQGVVSLGLKLPSILDNSNEDNWAVQSVPFTPEQENEFDADHDAHPFHLNELQYHTRDSINGAIVIDDDEFEFIELKNTSNVALDISHYFFSRGIEYRFPLNTIIPANDFIVIARDSTLFHARYGQASDGVYDGKLSNSGEEIWLHDINGYLIDAISYTDDLPWDSEADGSGYSLALYRDSIENKSANDWNVQCVESTLWADNKHETDIDLSGNLFEICAIDSLVLNTVEQGLSQGGDWTYNSQIVTAAQSAGIYQYTYTNASGCTTVDSIDVRHQIPDYVSTLAIAPSAIVGPKQVRTIISISEIKNEPSCTPVYVIMPKDISRYSFTYLPNALGIGGVSVDNSNWQYYSTNPSFHVWEFIAGDFQALATKKIGFIGLYNPNNTDGETTFTVQLFGGSGGELNGLNNSDSESLIYFK